MLGEYGRLLQAVAFHILPSHADVEEVVIDTMVTAWERIGSLRDRAALRPWLLRIAARHALARRRRSAPDHALLEGVQPTTSGADPDLIALAQALDALPPRMRACLSVHYYAGLSVAETANALGISANTVKFHLKAGLERLRVALEVEPMPDPRQEHGAMNGEHDIEPRLRRHLAAEADQLPFLLDAEVVGRRLAERRGGWWRPFMLMPVAALLVLAVAVGGALLASQGGTPSGGRQPWARWWSCRCRVGWMR